MGEVARNVLDGTMFNHRSPRWKNLRYVSNHNESNAISVENRSQISHFL